MRLYKILLVLSLALVMPEVAWAQTTPQVIENRSGIGIDGRGQLIFDPSKNVLDLVEAAIKRQDDLRRLVEELLKAELAAVSDKSEIRSKQDRELLTANTLRLDNEARLRAEFATQIAATEKARVDAIRLVDKNAVDQAGLVATQTAANLAKTVQESAAVLATQVNTSAEALRNLVATTAAESSRNTQQQFAAISTRIAALEQGSAQGVGERKFSDPAIAILTEEVRKLSRAQSISSGTDTGSSVAWGWIVAVVTIVIAFAGLVVAIVTMGRKMNSTSKAH